MEVILLFYKIFKKMKMWKKLNFIFKGICVCFKCRFVDVVCNNFWKCDYGGNRWYVY